MKKAMLAILTVLSALALGHGNARAADQPQSFVVTVNLTPACALGTVGGITFTYTGAQAGAATGSGGGFSLLCTTNLPYTFALDNDGGAATGSATSRTYQDAATLLNYTLATPAAGTGTGSSQSLSITATMASGQAGSCPSASACDNAASTNRSRTLTVSY